MKISSGWIFKRKKKLYFHFAKYSRIKKFHIFSINVCVVEIFLFFPLSLLRRNETRKNSPINRVFEMERKSDRLLLYYWSEKYLQGCRCLTNEHRFHLYIYIFFIEILSSIAHFKYLGNGKKKKKESLSKWDEKKKKRNTKIFFKFIKNNTTIFKKFLQFFFFFKDYNDFFQWILW